MVENHVKLEMVSIQIFHTAHYLLVYAAYSNLKETSLNMQEIMVKGTY